VNWWGYGLGALAGFLTSLILPMLAGRFSIRLAKRRAAAEIAKLINDQATAMVQTTTQYSPDTGPELAGLYQALGIVVSYGAKIARIDDPHIPRRSR